jgi:hypothetical protein
MNNVIKMCTSIVLFALSLPASAALISIESYDVDNTSQSFAGWSHNYDGNIIPDADLYDYTDGSGTLNDGVIGTAVDNTHLFVVDNDSSITVYFNSSFSLESLSLYSFGPTSNGIPGNISGALITMSGVSQFFNTSGFGPANPDGNNGRDHSHEFIDFSGSLLDGLSASSLTISEVQTEGRYTDYFSISEIEVTGSSIRETEVSEPSALAILGLVIVSMLRIKRKSQ